MAEGVPGSAWKGRLTLGLMLAPALLWLLALIVLPHIDLALLSFRERLAPRQYGASLAQYRTFFGEPLYWQVFVRTAVMSAGKCFVAPSRTCKVVMIVRQSLNACASSSAK